MSPSGYYPDFDLDREYGEGGEATVRAVLGLNRDRLEVKRKSYADDVFYVELEHDPGATGHYRPSGLATTKATYFAYVIADTGVIVLFPTALLKEACQRGTG